MNKSHKYFGETEKIESELRSFILENSRNEEQCSDLIYKYNLEFLLFDLINQKDNRYLETEKWIHTQEKEALIFEAEVKKLSLEFERLGVKMVNLKGVTLVKDIYLGNYSKRYFGDIDILVSYKDAYKALHILSLNGYYFQKDKKEISDETILACMEMVKNNRMHFPELEVERDLEDGSTMKLELDLHISLIHKHKLKISLTDEMIERAHQAKNININCNVLDINDQLIFLTHHLSKEFFRNDIRWCITCSRKIDLNERFNLRLLHDIALYIEKYKDEIEWNEIKNRLDVLNMTNDFVLILKLISYIYKSLVPYIPPFTYEHLIPMDQKYGKFYAITYAVNYEKELLLKTKGEFSKYIMMTAAAKCQKIYANRTYYINQEIRNRIVGCFISDMDDNHSIISMQYEYDDKNLVLKFKRNKNIDLISITLGTNKLNVISKAYINKFILNIKEKTLLLKNSTIDLTLNSFVEVFKDSIVVKFPKDFIQLNIEEGALLDIDDPNCFLVSSDEESVKKYELDNGNYPFSPQLMYLMKF